MHNHQNWVPFKVCLSGVVQGQSNDAPRIFTNDYFITHPEDLSLGETLFTLRASDPDGDTLTFSRASAETEELTQLGPAVQEPDGKWAAAVLLDKKLDVDNGPSTRTLYFSVSDGQNTINFNILLIITDVNDNPPSFTGLPYRTSVNEDEAVGTVVFTVSAKDPDEALGGQVQFQLRASSLADNSEYLETFSLTEGSNIGNINLIKSLDYEERSFYHFKVSAKDRGIPQCPGPNCVCDASAEVCRADAVDLFITVKDIQDTPPVFEKLPYIVSVPENQKVGSSIFQVTAVDGDRAATIRNQIEYSFLDGDHENFNINETDGTITVAAQLDVDNETVLNRGRLYIFTVQAREISPDGGSISSGQDVYDNTTMTSTKMSITVTDVNDNKPLFNHLTYQATVLENTPNGVPLTMTSIIEVSDRDQGLNSRFKIYLEKNGAVYRDFKTLPAEGQTIQGSTTITIVVVNSSVLDYEKEKTISFKLVAEEVGSNLTSEATVDVSILDANDNNPEFPEQQTSFNVSENAKIGYVVTTIQATDPDSGDQGKIAFSIENSDEESDFIIDTSTGVLSLHSELDRERRSSYSLYVIATDNPSAPESQRRRNRLFVSITVTDVNDHSPEWTQYIPQVSVMESEPINTTVTELRATDLDDGLNAEIDYSVSPDTNGSALFYVRKDGDRAKLLVERSLIGHPGVQIVKVIASDQGLPALNSTVEISVLVVDMNLHEPVFIVPDEREFNVTTGKLPEVTVDEELPIGSPLIQLKAEDVDLGQNGKVYYYLLPTVTRDYEYFRLDRITGVLSAERRLDRELKDVYEIQVKAEDNGQPAPLSTTLTMQVKLRDIDDNLPSYEGVTMPQRMNVEEESDNVVVGEVLAASDADSKAENSVICYYLYGGANMTDFQLNNRTRRLTLLKALDRETTEHLDIVIKASPDCTNAPQPFNPSDASSTPVRFQDEMAIPPSYNSSDHSLLWVRINIKDTNDNRPIFVEHAMSAGLIFDVEVGTVVMSLKNSVTDADTVANSVHMFILLDIKPVLEVSEGFDQSRPAFVLSRNGTLETNIIFRSDMMGYFLLQVEVSDPDGLSDQADIRIFLVSNLQRVKLVFNKLPNEVEAIKHDFIRELSDVLKLDLIIDRIMTHTAKDQTRNPTKTDAFIHGRYRDTDEVVPALDLWRAFDFNPAARAVLFKYGVSQAEELAQTAGPSSSSEELKRVMAIVTSALGIIVIALILVLVHLVRMYRRRLRAATTMAYTSPKEQEMYEHPGTNKYYAAENPLFGKEIKPADVEDDRTSHNSLDVNMVDSPPPAPPAFADEEQEVVLSISDSPEPLDPDFGPGPKHSLNLSHVLEAYDNPAFETDSKTDGLTNEKSPVGNGHLRGVLFANGGSTVPGMEEAVTRFSDDVLSKDSGYPEGPYTQSHMEHSDI